MLELIDQSDALRLIYRCSNCQAEGMSSPAFAPANRFFDGNQKPNRWVRHTCGQPAPLVPGYVVKKAEAPAPTVKRATRKQSVAVVADAPKAKRTRKAPVA